MSKHHSCAIPGCNHMIPASRLMCRDHWFEVPGPLRHAINSTWKNGEIGAYRRNVEEAVRVVSGTEPAAEPEAEDAAD
ncbi:hypothetical protein [Ferrovibrio terrae]|uniref:hypothetical protein n=1 Tax=Ferrovibrio terrae TaxID=2594003 RepID=UPI003138328C